MAGLAELDRRKTNVDCWRDTQQAIDALVEEAICDVMNSGGRVTQISLELPVHGFRPGQPIVGIKRKVGT